MKCFVFLTSLISIINFRGVVEAALPVFTVTANKEMLNVGEEFITNCNVPDETALNIVNKYFVKWYYEDVEVAYFSDVNEKYKGIMSSKVSALPNGSNVTITLVINSVTKSNEGRYSCKIIEKGSQTTEDTKSVNLMVRSDIKKMEFKFDNSIDRMLTLSNTNVTHHLEIKPGSYSPSCMAEGSTPKPTVKIMMGDMEMKGRMIDLDNGTKFQSDPYKFPTGKSELEHMVKCVTMVPGVGPPFKAVRTYHVVTRVVDPKFMCTNSSAMVNDKRHKITCKITGVEGITCNKVLWEDRAKDEQFTIGRKDRLNIICNPTGMDSLETSLEFDYVQSSDFATTYAVIYNDRDAKTTKYDVFIAQELSSGIKVQSPLLLMLAMFMTSFLL